MLDHLGLRQPSAEDRRLPRPLDGSATRILAEAVAEGYLLPIPRLDIRSSDRWSTVFANRVGSNSRSMTIISYSEGRLVAKFFCHRRARNEVFGLGWVGYDQQNQPMEPQIRFMPIKDSEANDSDIPNGATVLSTGGLPPKSIDLYLPEKAMGLSGERAMVDAVYRSIMELKGLPFVESRKEWYNLAPESSKFGPAISNAIHLGLADLEAPNL